jgi:hypothetical protein
MKNIPTNKPHCSLVIPKSLFMVSAAMLTLMRSM